MNPLDYDFMRNAYLAAGIVSVLAAATGYFLVLRGQSFAGHALGHVGFAGAALGAWAGLSPLGGLIAITAAGGAGMGLLGSSLEERDVGIGMVLALSLGLGLLFLGFITHSAVQATSLLFGNILGVDRATVLALAAIAAASLLSLGLIARPLLFASLQPELAEARGLRLRALSVAFLGLVGLAVAASAQIVGVLLVFALMVGPAAAAQNLTVRVGRGFALAVTIAVAQSLCAITLAFYTDWPVSFWVTALSTGTYLAALAAR